MSESLNLSFKNITTATLPFIFQDVNTTPFSHNYLAAHSHAAAEYLALPKTVNEHPDFVKILCGELLPDGGRYTAQGYAGHQQQNNANPKYILRNCFVETAIRSANTSDLCKKTPDWGKELEISCSS